MQDFAGGLDPVIDECRLQLGDSWPFDAKMRVAPFIRLLPVAKPLIGDPHSTGEPYPAVDH